MRARRGLDDTPKSSRAPLSRHTLRGSPASVDVQVDILVDIPMGVHVELQVDGENLGKSGSPWGKLRDTRRIGGLEHMVHAQVSGAQ